jgi:hypothetical protein
MYYKVIRWLVRVTIFPIETRQIVFFILMRYVPLLAV